MCGPIADTATNASILGLVIGVPSYLLGLVAVLIEGLHTARLNTKGFHTDSMTTKEKLSK